MMFLSAALPAGAQVNDYRGTVTRIIDGETVLLRYLGQHISVRLAGVDAPAGDDPYGKEAAESLAQLCDQYPAEVVSAGTDDYGRLIGEVYCKGVNANEEQLRRGMARLDAEHAPETWSSVERRARAAHRGVWSSPASSLH